MTGFFELGRVLKPQGIRGEMKAELYSDDPARVLDLQQIYFRRGGKYVAEPVAAARTDGRFAYLRLAGVADRDAAEKLRDQIFYIDRAHAAPLAEGAFYISDLVGLPVFLDGRQIGVLKDIMQTGSADIYVTTLADGRQLLFPAVPDVFRVRDVEAGRIELEPGRLQEVGVYDV